MIMYDNVLCIHNQYIIVPIRYNTCIPQPSVIASNISNVFKEGELDKESNMQILHNTLLARTTNFGL